MAMSPLKQQLLKEELARLGFPEAKYSPKEDAMLVNPSDKNVMKVLNSGCTTYYREHVDIGNAIRTVSEKVNEIISAWENAMPIPIERLNHHRILAEYNGVVLAARDDSEYTCGHTLMFVTWRYNHDHTGFDYGTYSPNYEAMKEDFVSRSGLINQYKIFNEAELKLIHQGLVHLGADYPNLTAEQMTSVDEIIKKVEIVIPDIQDAPVYEEHELVAEGADDELEA